MIIERRNKIAVRVAIFSIIVIVPKVYVKKNAIFIEYLVPFLLALRHICM
jgi:hypothetical protein